MPHWRPLATASLATALTLALAVGSTGGHSPFGEPAPAAAHQPVADATAASTDTSDAPSQAPSASDAPAATATAVSAKATARPRGSGTKSTQTNSSAPGGANPTPRPTTRPTSAPTPRATSAPTAAPIAPPVGQPGTLRVSDGEAGPRLSWTTCAASNFAAYAVVRSLDSEIHYPAEDLDTVVAIVSSPSATSLTDTTAPNTRVWYAVWCLSQHDGEYQTIWKTPTVAYAA